MEKIKQLRKLLTLNGLEGYIVPKNDEFFNENVQINPRSEKKKRENGAM